MKLDSLTLRSYDSVKWHLTSLLFRRHRWRESTMKRALITSLNLGILLLGYSPQCHAQFAGGMGGSRAEDRSNDRNSPASIELQKRQPTPAELRPDGSAMFIAASVVMNVKADEYVAIFGVAEEGATPLEAGAKMDATIAAFKTSLKALGVKESDLFVDFVTQNRVYSYKLQENVAREELTGFELKKNVSIHFTDKLLLDKLAAAAAKVKIYDLSKVDYVVKNLTALQADLQKQTLGLINQKAKR
ncbi:DUF541 domain-containing protein [bacterium]|nr:MAG: DUF541 domain-containing protein [bacterium]